ncbi:MAG: hypothetical protein AVDCRST_MAG03-1196 [uncultured Rubrobacteraceae bacterium]|uniref:Uncharacterized protein n=1 Tax=uncultured Rubrobacteraceae bacterium TaxID=349277 RepID=A0A6J4P0B2_9ACTN|nr:MAG: hypothetical protein AVDCRST_MAG03-1196 [uncultured Rubrobacteraceae bacterium]
MSLASRQPGEPCTSGALDHHRRLLCRRGEEMGVRGVVCIAAPRWDGLGGGRIQKRIPWNFSSLSSYTSGAAVDNGRRRAYTEDRQQDATKTPSPRVAPGGGGTTSDP